VVEGDYLWLGGTSMACPHVSGALAVLISRFPAESAAELRGRLRAGARDVDAANPGYEGLLGSGALDLPAALAAEPQPLLRLVGVDPPDLPLDGGQVGVAVRLKNFWSTAAGVSATLGTSHPGVTVDDGTASFGDVPLGETRSNALDPFQLTLAPGIPPGSSIDFEVALSASGGYAETLPFRMKLTLFADRTAASGLSASSLLPLGVTMQDYGGDGLPDVLSTGIFHFGFFRNLGLGVFADARAETGVSVNPVGILNSLFFDPDADGDRDIAIAGNGNPPLYPTYFFRNVGGGVFRNRSVASGLAGKAFTAVISADYDRDGLLDLLGGSFEFALMRNEGDGTFRDRTAAAHFGVGGVVPGFVWGLLTLDYDDDGDPDVAGVTGNHGVFLLANDGDGTFSDALAASGIDNSRKGGLGVAAGDYDNDGDIDLFLTGIGRPGESDRNALYRNEGGGTFLDVTAQSGDLALGTASGFPGTDFFDYDNDGDLDLLLTSEGVPNEVFYHVLYRNDGDGVFTIVSEEAFPTGFLPGAAVAAIGDYDRDGSLDVYAPDGAFGGAGRGGLLRNQIGARHHWLRVDLEGSPREPYGARVRVVTDGIVRTREVHSSPVEPLPLHFGLGEATTVDRIEVRWPDGSTKRVGGVAADREISIRQAGVFCEGAADADADGVVDSCDNCAEVANPGQADADADGVGDACNDAADGDGDEWSDALDVCPLVADPGQEDGDGDYVGDPCDVCPAVFDPGQEDEDGDGIGDACAPPVTAVDIDVRPGNPRNVVEPSSHALLRVAVLGSARFDAAEIDPASLAFGPSRAGATLPPQPLRDVNGDGLTDLLLLFPVAEAGIQLGDTQVCLRGRTRSGERIAGCDAVTTVPPRGPRSTAPL
jgi:hypothetical protein